MVIENGNVFEKGCVNVSKVHGTLPKVMSEVLGVTESEFLLAELAWSFIPITLWLLLFTLT